MGVINNKIKIAGLEANTAGIMTSVTSCVEALNTTMTSVNSLKTTVGNNTSGLVKDVNDLITDLTPSDLIGVVKWVKITTGYSWQDTLADLKTYYGTLQNYHAVCIILANNFGQTQGMGFMYKYSDSYGGILFFKYATDKIRYSNNGGSGWVDREI